MDLVSDIEHDKARREAEEAKMKQKEEKKRKSDDGTPTTLSAKSKKPRSQHLQGT